MKTLMPLLPFLLLTPCAGEPTPIPCDPQWGECSGDPEEERETPIPGAAGGGAGLCVLMASYQAIGASTAGPVSMTCIVYTCPGGVGLQVCEDDSGEPCSRGQDYECTGPSCGACSVMQGWHCGELPVFTCANGTGVRLPEGDDV